MKHFVLASLVALTACGVGLTVDQASSDSGTNAPDACTPLAKCPSPDLVVAGESCCPQTTLVCNGTIENNCGVPIGDLFQCDCWSGHWRCEGPDASGAVCDGGAE